MILFIKGTTKALIILRVCAGWSAPVLFTNTRRQVFSRQGPYFNQPVNSLQKPDALYLYMGLVARKPVFGVSD